MSAISNELKEKIRHQSKNRCGYCLIPQEIYPLPLEIEHLYPKSAGGTDTEENLWLACRVCNNFKHTKIEVLIPRTNRKISVFNPRRQIWREHFEFNQDQTKIIGKTDCGRATVRALKLNNELAVSVRKKWVGIDWYPPKDY